MAHNEQLTSIAGGCVNVYNYFANIIIPVMKAKTTTSSVQRVACSMKHAECSMLLIMGVYADQPVAATTAATTLRLSDFLYV